MNIDSLTKVYLCLLRFFNQADFSFIKSTIWTVRSKFHLIKRLVVFKRKLVDIAPLIENAIREKTPLAVGKMGSVECASVQIYLKRKNALLTNRKIPRYPLQLFIKLHLNAGVFPKNEDTYDAFCRFYLLSVVNCDALAAWDISGELMILKRFCKKTTLVKLRSLEPYFSEKPWTRVLEGKRVLVISPFSDTIKSQYSRRQLLWMNTAILPEFTLLTIKAPFSAGIVDPESSSWFEALNSMRIKMEREYYDVVLIGAGAFSLPLISYAKEMGKVGIHLGGGLQILFGIVGNRWKNNKDFTRFINKYWTAPSDLETPELSRMIEGGCYW